MPAHEPCPAVMVPAAVAATVAVGLVLALRFRPAFAGRIEVPAPPAGVAAGLLMLAAGG